MYKNKKVAGGAGTLIAAGLAAFAYYKYSKMSEEQKQNLVNDLKEKAQNLYEQYAPTELKDLFAKKGTENTERGFSEDSSYSS